jgi:hypothetical protein
MDMFPNFIPCKYAEASVEAQEQLYSFMKNMYQVFYDRPELLYKVIYEDDSYPYRYNRKVYGKPNLLNHMKSDLKKMDAWLNFLYELGRHGVNSGIGYIIDSDFIINKGNLSLLKELGFAREDNFIIHMEYPEIFKAWNYITSREDVDMVAFARCMFDPKYNYMEDIYAKLFGDEKTFRKLTKYLVQNGYERYERRRGAYSLDYAMEHADIPSPLGNPLHGDPNHTGVSFEYKPDVAIPQYLVIRILGMKEMLLRFEDMSADLQDFVWQHCKHCDNCNYCTQTDKSGKKKRLFIEVTCRVGTAKLCPLYPGFSSTFELLDEKLYKNIVEYLEFMDGKQVQPVQ